MRLYSIHLVAAVTLFAYIEASALESQPEPTLPETSGHGHTSDQTFPQNGTNSVDEERMPSSNVVRGIGGATHSMESLGNNFAERAQQWTEELKEKSAREAFDYLKLHEAGDDVFRSPDFPQWKYFGTGAQGEDTYEAMAEVLLAHFDNFHLVIMLEAAKKVEETKVIATELQKARFAVWTRKCEKELGLTSLKRLGPDLNSEDLFRDPPSDAWDKFVDADDLVYIEYEMLLRMLLDLYNEVDLAKAFHAAMEISKLKNTAECLQLHLGWHWKVTKPPYEQLFVDLGLDPTKDDFVGSPLFRTWYNVVVAEVYRHDSAVVEFLKARLGDFGLAKALEAAKKVDSAEDIVDNLEEAFIYEWHYDHPHEVFDRLGLKATSDELLGIPLFKLWYKFATEKNWKDREVVKILLTRSDNFSFAKMLDAAKKVNSTRALAIKLEDAYISLWHFKEIKPLFDKLGLKATSVDLLGIPLFKSWYKYAKEEISTLGVVEILESHLGRFNFAKMLDAATKVDDTKKIALELQAAQFNYWDRRRVSEAKVNEETRPAKSFMKIRKREFGQSVSAGDFTVGWKYGEYRQKIKSRLNEATRSTRSL